MVSLVLQWVDEIGGSEQLSDKLLKQKKREKLPTFIPPKVFKFSSNLSDLHALIEFLCHSASSSFNISIVGLVILSSI